MLSDHIYGMVKKVLVKAYMLGAVTAVAVMLMLLGATVVIKALDNTNNNIAATAAAALNKSVDSVKSTTYGSLADRIWSNYLFWLPAAVVVGAALVYALHTPRR